MLVLARFLSESLNLSNKNGAKFVSSQVRRDPTRPFERPSALVSPQFFLCTCCLLVWFVCEAHIAKSTHIYSFLSFSLHLFFLFWKIDQMCAQEKGEENRKNCWCVRDHITSCLRTRAQLICSLSFIYRLFAFFCISFFRSLQILASEIFHSFLPTYFQ